MKRLALIVGLLLCAAPAWAQTYVNSTSKVCTSATTCALTYSPTAGNALFIGLEAPSSSTTITGLADNGASGGSTYTVPLSASCSGGSAQRCGFAYTCNVASGVTSITLTLGGADTPTITVAEYSGVATSACLDQSSTAATGTGTSQTGNDVTTTQANEVLIGYVIQGTNSTSPFTGANGFTARVNQAETVNPSVQALMDKTVTSIVTDHAASTTGASVAWQIYTFTFKAPGFSSEQTHFRFRNDDGSESAATWLADEDTNLTQPLSTNTRLRMQADTVGASGSQQYRLEYEKSGGSWAAVPTSSSTTSTITQRGTPVKANGTTACTGTAPTGVANGDVLYAFVTDHATSGSSSAPTGWSWIGGTAAAAGRFQAFRCIMDSGSCSGTSWSFTGLTTRAECVVTAYYNVDTATPEDGVTPTAQNNASGTTGAATITPNTSGDMILGGFTSLANNATWSAEATATSPGTLAESYDGANSTYCSIALANAIQSSAAATGASSATMSTNAANAGILLALKPVVTANPIFLYATANITASAATSTTAQLSVPNSHSFTALRISDDANPLPALTLGSSNYGEAEWNLLAATPAADGDIYTFRLTMNGTVLTTYSVTPQWTIGTAGGGVRKRVASTQH
ncbi:MAG: hypothetical protein LAN70_18215 [Acidobacteriia bacterium]|nr:hypothetical protein [Terriglobia bacterium]